MVGFRDVLCLVCYCLLYIRATNGTIDCQSECRYDLEPDGDDYYCNRECQILQCLNGCMLYPDALTSQTCQGVCTDSLSQNTSGWEQDSSVSQIKKQSCTQGCVFGLKRYFDIVIQGKTELSALQLVLGSKSYNSVELFLDGVTDGVIELGNVTYFLQRKIVDQDTDWQIHNATYRQASGNFLVTNLRPYVTYKFKMIFKVTSIHSLETNESVPITTAPYGVPSSAPKIRSINAPSSTVISVSWSKPVYTNGPLLSYRLTLRPLGDSSLHPVSNDVAPDCTSWMFGHLHSHQYYTVSVSAVNEEGVGPGSSSSIATPSPGNLSDQDTPYLVLGADNMVVKQRMLELTREAESVLKKPSSILVTGVGVHVAEQLLVVTDDSGHVTLISLSGDNQADDVYPTLFQPLAVDVDWLHNHAYVVDGQRIYQCTMRESGNRCIIATDISPHRPREVKVDPINGYVYFTILNTKQGLYRMDIGDISADSQPLAKLLLDADLQTFTIDHENLLLYFPENAKNTVMSAYLDGTGVTDMRQNLVARPNFVNIASMVYFEEKFFWTNGSKVFSEEYDAGNQTYYHNPLLLFEKHFQGFNMYCPQAQPIPAPINPPSMVQALFTAYKVLIRWQKPARLQFQGKGAFSAWDYEVHLQTDDGSHNTLNQTEKKLKLEVTNLQPDTQYRVKVRAKSAAGTGPWSKVFIGRTLKDELDSAKLIIAVPYQLRLWHVKEVDMDGLLPKTIGETSLLYPGVTDLAWYLDMTFWTTDEGRLFMSEEAGTDPFMLGFVEDAACVAFDWLGERLYWSVWKNGVIKRSDLYGNGMEFVYQALARDMVVDSIQGRLYWVTMNSVESAYLNGKDQLEYFSVPYFSGKHVISLSINHDLQKLFWYVKDFENQALYTADLVGYHGNRDVINTVELVGNFENIAKFSMLEYFSFRLLWLNQNLAITVGNTECNYTSSITAIHSEVVTFTIKHPSLQPYPAGLNGSTVQVIPLAVPAASITCEGVWSDFNITWQPSIEVNHGKVTYELSVHGQEHINTIVATENTWFSMSGLPPFQPITVSVRGYTHWGSGPLTTISIRTPMSVPTKPQDPKVYVTQRKNAASSKLTLAADFRWIAPDTINGILSYQHVFYWQSTKPHRTSSTTLPAAARHFILDGLEGNTTYFFQVESCTSVGCGPRSEVANATADAVNPVPKLMIATPKSIVLADADNILNSSDTIVRKSIVAMAFLAQDNRNFLIGTDKYLEEYHQSSTKKLLRLDGEALDMSLDWISRTLYIVETNVTTTNLVSYQLDQAERLTLLQRPGLIGNIVIDPYTSTLLWSERTSPDNHWTIVSKSVEGSEVSELFSGSGRRGRQQRSVSGQCNCSQSQQVGSALTMDLSQDGKTKVVFVDMATVSLMAADVYGCRCRTLLTTTATDRQGLPPDYLTVDHVHVYWYNKQDQQLYAFDKATGKIRVTSLPNVNNIVAYGAHLQPFPGSECLDIDDYSGNISVIEHTNVTLSVSLDAVKWPDSCAHISHPAVKYTLYYKKLDDVMVPDDCWPEGQACIRRESYGREITLEGLAPYESYVLHAAASNYYTEYSAATIGPPTIIRTRPGVPVPVNVSAKSQTPNRIEIKWLPPEKPNGPLDTIIYYIRWSAVMDGVSRTMLSDAYNLSDINHDGFFSTSIAGLTADHTYSIQVLSTQLDGGYETESQAVKVHTYQEPADIELLEATNTSIQVTWRSASKDGTNMVSFYYAELVGTGEPDFRRGDLDLPIKSNGSTLYNRTFEGLRPNTEYAFWLSIIYKEFYSLVYWPEDDNRYLQYVFKTMTGVPGYPEPPVVEEFKSGEFEVKWEPPTDNGEPILQYKLQYRQIEKENWSLVHNTNDTRWVLDDNVLPRGYPYVFRVQAENKNGWGPYSLNSSVFTYPLEAEIKDGMITIVAVVSASVFVILMAIIIAVCYCCVKNRDMKKDRRQKFVAVPRGPDQELATLRELPNTAIQQSNALYSANMVPTDEEVAALPHFRRNQLVLCKFLGSGAFGEVFEGIAKNIISDDSGETKVAVKTLRKSASDQEKEEFLKEALLMSNFRHEHILSLLGVCLDNDPQFIILELMEGGDLLSFMRSCRLSSIQNRAELSLTDLVKICVHVARGCKYLEDMHFVHRDLAARNCLVSSCKPSDMMVKIGDFGLARDIYKNDYYRKEGEGLLPVRWMSPESLVDGVFTTQSDIWAFGILMWEVVTFGQQPYPARTNIEVLHYVRSGGRLDRSDNCPDDFYQLMCKCWRFAPEDRPSFSYLLQQLTQFQETCASISEYLVPIRSSNTPIAADDRYDNDMFDAVEEAGLELWVISRVLRPPPPLPGGQDRTSTRHSRKCKKEVDGYKYLPARRGRLTSTSSDGPEYHRGQTSQYGSQRMYGTIHRATSFDSPVPKDTTPQLPTDASNYMEPSLIGTPKYVEFLPDSKTMNYLYNGKGERIRTSQDTMPPGGARPTSRGPSYVQTTVQENFGGNGEYMRYLNQRSLHGNDKYLKYIQPKGIPKTGSKETVDTVLQALSEGREHDVLISDNIFQPDPPEQHVNQGVTMEMSSRFRKQRLDSSTSCMSFDSVQTEPAYHCTDLNQRNKLYSTSSSKSNYSMTNIAEQLHCPSAEIQKGQKFWNNNNNNNNNSNVGYTTNKSHGPREVKGRADYLHMNRRGQVHPETKGVMTGYDNSSVSYV